MPLLNFLNHEVAYKDSIRSGKWSQPPLQPNTRQNELCTAMAWLGMTRKKPDQPKVEPLHSHEACNQQLQPDTSQTHCTSSVPLARVALPCLASAALLPLGKGSIQYITEKSSPSIS